MVDAAKNQNQENEELNNLQDNDKFKLRDTGIDCGSSFKSVSDLVDHGFKLCHHIII